MTENLKKGNLHFRTGKEIKRRAATILDRRQEMVGDNLLTVAKFTPTVGPRIHFDWWVAMVVAGR